jgi:hypothetical protein
MNNPRRFKVRRAATVMASAPLVLRKASPIFDGVEIRRR